MLRKLAIAGGFAMAMAFMLGTAKADTVTYTQTNGAATYTAMLTVSSGSANLTFGGDLNSLYTDSVAIHIENGATVLASSTSSATGWTLGNGKNANENSSCTVGGTENWFCGKGPLTSFNRLSFTWNFTGGSPTSPYSIQFAVCRITNCDTGQGGGFVTYFSQDGPVSTPEPGTLFLLGVGLLPLLFFGRRFISDPDSR